ncbi:MAG: hotdog domain-containing protein [Clostridia bacterium]
MESLIRVRMSSHDAHYAGELVDGAKILQFFGDVATELLIKYDGDEGLFAAYDNVEFLAPVYSGDYLEISGKIVKVGNTSREMEFIAKKVITSANIEEQPSACDVLKEPIIVAKASGTCVVPKDLQRGNGNG